MLCEQLEALQDDATAATSVPGGLGVTRFIGDGGQAVSSVDETLGGGPTSMLGGARHAASRAREALSDGASYVAVKGGII